MRLPSLLGGKLPQWYTPAVLNESDRYVMRKGAPPASKTSNGVLCLLVLACSLTGCERSTHVSVQGGAIPVFSFSGSGELGDFAVFGQEHFEKAESPFDDSFALWEIKPIDGDLHGTPVERLGRITYGVVPPRYMQVKPPSGSPLPLVEGQKYFFQAVTTNAPWAAGYIEVRNSHAELSSGPGICFGGKDGKWIRVPCRQ